MTADDDRTLDPDRIATRGFSTSFRGFDTDEVRRFLEGLADALRTQREEVSGVAVVESENEAGAKERDDLASRIADLEGRLSEAQANLRQAEEDAAAAKHDEAEAPDATSVQELDEATMTALLGQETTRVLDAARDAARDIRTRAEEESKQRLDELETTEQTVRADLEKERADLDEQSTKVKADAEEEAARVTTEALTAAAAARSEAEGEAKAKLKAAREEASEVLGKAKEESVRLKAQAETEVSSLRTEAEETAANVRASAEADASSSQDAAREQARQMLNEAQAVREKVLADLVKRRRVGRQQLDQVKAARDRLARSLAVVRKELDEAMGELVTAVPDARAAMEAVGRRVPESSDKRQAVELGVELDTARVAGIPLPGMPDDDDVDPMPDIDELFNRIKSGDDPAEGDDSKAGQSGENKKPEANKSGATKSEATKSEPKAAKPKQAERQKAQPQKAQPKKAQPKKVESKDSEPRQTDSPRSNKGPTAAASAVTTSTAPAPSREEDKDQPAADESAESAESAVELDIPSPFIDRDVAMTRFGPDLRRQVKRALADDQSHILDLLRRATGPISVETLPSADELEGPYRQALQTALAGSASAGASAAGGSGKNKPTVTAEIDELVASIIGNLLNPLRQKIERVVTDANDKNEVTEPLRAHYREVRSNQLPDLVDDALASAFALGHYSALKSGSSVVWLGDPRVEAGPDCHDNTLAGPMKKAEKFPTGHVLPPGSPGCRCLVVAAG